MAKAPAALNEAPEVPIFTIRGKRVVLDSDLAALYGSPTKRLNEQVRRNPERFPPDFAFLLSQDEWESLRSQIATLKTGRGSHRKYLPYVFTEHGALMAASVLNSPRAIEVSIYVVRTFVAIRDALLGSGDVARRLDALEKKLEDGLSGHDQAIAEILRAIRALMAPADVKRRPIGFIDPSQGT